MRARSWSALAATSLLALVGCSTSGAAPVAAPPDAHLGGALRLGITTLSSLDPVMARDPMSATVFGLTCEALLGVSSKGQLEPGLVESWQVGDSGRRLTFTLRKGLRFQDGSKLTADDAVRTLSRVAQGDTASPWSDLLSRVVGYDDWHGLTDPSTEDLEKGLRGVQVISVGSFEITLSESNADFLRTLTLPFAAPQRKGGGSSGPPTCVAPYRVEQHSATSVRLVRSGTYYGRRGIGTYGGKGFVDRVEVTVARDAAALVRAFRSGRLDVAVLPSGSNVTGVAAADLHRSSRGAIELVGLPLSTPPYDDPDVRLAMSRALDRATLARVAFKGWAKPALGFLPSTLVGATKACETGDGDTSAGDVLAGKSLALYVNDDHENLPMAREVARQWSAAFRMKVRVVTVPWSELLAKGTGAGAFDGAFRESWRAEAASPDAYLHPLFASQSVGRHNFSRFNDPVFDKALNRRARETADDEDRQLEYLALARALCQKMPMIPVVEALEPVLIRAAAVASAADLVEPGSGLPALRDLYLKETP